MGNFKIKKESCFAGFSACGGSRKRHLLFRRSAIHRRFLYDREGTFLSYKKVALAAVCAALLFWEGLGCPATETVQAAQKDSVVVVIDPGHGGTGGRNEGGIFGTNVEKHLTMLTAQAMKQTLEQFEGVRVFLTREDDREVSLTDRAKIAKQYGADLMVSLHYNMSSDHSLYGAEAWTSAFGDEYAKGQSFARLWLSDVQAAYGLYGRGAKVRLGSSGKDYYGVIRAARERGIPCVILEHCHLDNANDNGLVSAPEQIAAFGVTDALSVAKYFQLKSTALGLDYSGFSSPAVTAPGRGAQPDSTAPQILSATAKRAGEGTISVTVEAADPESGLLYYSWSADGGLSWSALQRWPGGETATFSCPVPASGSLLVRAHNAYDLTAQAAVTNP